MTTPPGPPTDDALALACLTLARDDTPAPADGLEPGQAADRLDLGPIHALVCRVPADYFAGEDADRRLADVQWITPRAVRHDRIVRDAFARGPVMPARFGTVFSSETALRAAVAPHASAIARHLGTLRGMVELSLKLRIDRDRLLEAVAHQRLLDAEREGPLAPGRRFLELRRQRDAARKDVARHVASLADSIRDQVRGFGIAAVDLRPPAEDQGPPVEGHWALLVPEPRLGEVHTWAAGVAPPGTTLEVSGPWPTYSFAPTLAA